MPAPKRISTDQLRQFLGESETDALLERLKPAKTKPTVPVDIQSLTLARTLYSDPLTESKKWGDTIPVVRRYFFERGQSRRAFLDWLEQAPGELGDGDDRAPQQRRGARSPDTSEARRVAPSKTREGGTRR